MKATIKVDVEYTSADWSTVDSIEITLEQKHLDLIKDARVFLEKYPMVNKVCTADINAHPVGDEDIRSDYAELRIYSGDAQIYCQSKYDSASYWEAGVNLEEVKKKLKLNGYINNLK